MTSLEEIFIPNNASSQLIELSLNEQNYTARETFSWTAPEQYYTQYLGAAIILPNGDWMGDFGSPTHEFSENAPWNFNDTGAVIVEVNSTGQIVRTITFPSGWSIYRVGLVTNLGQNAFNLQSSPLPIVGSIAVILATVLLVAAVIFISRKKT